MERILVLLFLLIQTGLILPVQAQDRQTVTVCFDPTTPAQKSRNDVVPQNPDEFFSGLIQATFKRVGINVIYITDYPFKRCLNEVQNRRIDFVLGAYFDSERAKIFDYSNHYYTLTPQVFYLATKPIVIRALADLKRYHGCGIYGSTYAHYGLRPEELDLGPGYDSMIKKLRAGRCDYFVEELEVINELKSAGNDYLADGSVLHADVPGAIAPSRYLVTAKNSPASGLLGKINKALEETIALPQTQEAWKKEYGTVIYKP